MLAALQQAKAPTFGEHFAAYINQFEEYAFEGKFGTNVTEYKSIGGPVGGDTKLPGTKDPSKAVGGGETHLGYLGGSSGPSAGHYGSNPY